MAFVPSHPNLSRAELSLFIFAANLLKSEGRLTSASTGGVASSISTRISTTWSTLTEENAKTRITITMIGTESN